MAAVLLCEFYDWFKIIVTCDSVSSYVSTWALVSYYPSFFWVLLNSHRLHKFPTRCESITSNNIYMFCIQTLCAVIPKAAGQLHYILTTVLTNKSIITFAVKVFSNHPIYIGFGLFLEAGLHIKVYNIHRNCDYFRFLLHLLRESEQGFNPCHCPSPLHDWSLV